MLAGDSKYCLVGEAWGFTGKQALSVAGVV